MTAVTDPTLLRPEFLPATGAAEACAYVLNHPAAREAGLTCMAGIRNAKSLTRKFALICRGNESDTLATVAIDEEKQTFTVRERGQGDEVTPLATYQGVTDGLFKKLTAPSP